MAASDIPRDPESKIDMPSRLPSRLPSPLLDIQNRNFASARRGYDRAEVDAFLKHLSETISELLEERNVIQADSTTAPDPESVAESTAILEDAEARASRRLHAATLEAGRLRTEARRTLDKAIKEAQEVENAVRANAEQITNEATEMRQQILRDLLRRRKEAQTHVEMLRAARDELLNVFNQVRRITAQVKEPLDSALDRAKQAADVAAKRAQEDQQETLTHFEAELQTARLSGIIPVSADVEAEQGTTGTIESPVESPVESPEQVATTEPVAKPDSEEVQKPAPISEIIEEPEPVAPELDDIFARLRESASQSAFQPNAQAASQPEETESAETVRGSRQAKPSKKPSKSSQRRSARKRASKKSGANTAANATAAEVASPEVASPEDADIDAQEAAQIEDLKRQIRRALTTDESKVLQAIHRLHNKAPKKADELQTVLSSQDTRTAEFAELLAVHPDHIQNLLVAPLSSSLVACNTAESDTKTLVQQVRDVYRSFSQEQIASVATELVKHATEITE